MPPEFMRIGERSWKSCRRFLSDKIQSDFLGFQLIVFIPTSIKADFTLQFFSRPRAPLSPMMVPLINFNFFFNESHPFGSRERKRTFLVSHCEYISMKWWPIARDEMAIESKRGPWYPAEIQKLYASSRWGRLRAFFSSSWAKNKYQIHPRVIENGQKN